MPAARKPRAPSAGARAANRARGELALELGGQTFSLRPTHESVLAIEEELDLTGSEIVTRAAANRLKTREIGVIVAELVRAGAEPDSFEAHASTTRITQLVADRGVFGFYPIIRDLFLEIITGGRDIEGNVKPVASPSPPATATGN